MSWLFLVASLIGAWFTYNAFFPSAVSTHRSGISFFAGWLTSELALHHIAWQAVATLLFIASGALAAWPGWLGLLITIASWVGLWRCYWGAQEAETAMEAALQRALGADYRDRIDAGVGARLVPAIDWRQILLPFPMRHPEVERIRNVTYCQHGKVGLRLDVYRRRGQETPTASEARRPALLQIHGGGWVIGSKNEQGIPLMLEMASRGWVCFTADYRLSPRATFPDHLIDLKHAIKWIREHGSEYGADPSFIVVTGGSAGGHLAALLALTANDPEYQPGFEGVDTSVQGCVPFYGVYDFTNRHGVYPNRGLARLLEKRVMKAALAEAGEKYDRASPLSRVRSDAPPFLIIHGDKDTLVPVGDARHFYAALKLISGNAVGYAEIPGAQHAFEIFPSLRTTFVIHGVQRFLAYLYSDYLQRRRSEGTAEMVASIELEPARMEHHNGNGRAPSSGPPLPPGPVIYH